MDEIPDRIHFDNEEDLVAWLNEHAVPYDELTPEQQAEHDKWQAFTNEWRLEHQLPPVLRSVD